MSARDRLFDSLAPARERWRGLDARSRSRWLLAAGGLALLVLYAFLWLPTQREHARLETRLAALQRDEAAMAVQSREALALLAQPAGRAANPTDLAAVQALAGEGVSVSAQPGGGFRLMSAAFPTARWGALLDDLNRRGLVLKTLELAPKQDVKENVSFDMVIAAP